ncbi:MAG: hypothetical protein JXR84_24415 [Anaerolineae bacterium]|nr:hypothetical protein [Anaerolineae bacterium]
MNRRRIFIGALVSVCMLIMAAGFSQVQATGLPHITAPAAQLDTHAATQRNTSPLAQIGTGFTYQGQLTSNGQFFNDTCDMTFRLYDAVTDGNQVGSPIAASVPIINSLFTVYLDFGNVFTSDARWLAIDVKCTGDAGYTTLTPRQPIKAVPVAITALNSSGGADGWALTGNAGIVPGVHFLGTTDGVSLTLMVSGTTALRLEPHSSGYPNVIGGHSSNLVRVAGGYYGSTIGGGSNSTIAARFATIGGGYVNVVSNTYGTIAGGSGNVVSAIWGGNIGGGSDNTAAGAYYPVIGGGRYNVTYANYATVAGGRGNVITTTGHYAAIGGGNSNIASNYYTTVGGGYSNEASGGSATVAGGYNNTATQESSTVGGGGHNTASGIGATVGGGGWNGADPGGNQAIGNGSTIGGGYLNTTNNWYSTISGGSGNEATGAWSAIPGGELNTASGSYSFAAGRRAQATHAGSFVWADSTDADFSSTATNQFLVRAGNGLETYAATATGYAGRFINSTAGGMGLYVEAGDDYAADLVLGGNDNGRMSSNPAYDGSDLQFFTNDAFDIYLNADEAGADADNDFNIYNGIGNTLIFNVDEGGTTSVKVLAIQGGADLAEQFDISSTDAEIEPAPGMVVCIDAANPGALIVCDTAYARTVAGAVSGAGGLQPGMVMGQADTIAAGDYPVALTGRVYVMVDASYGAVQPGDLLTTSDTPGHAMKVGDYDRAQGAILGKAMSSLDAGTGLVLVLVTLQ